MIGGSSPQATLPALTQLPPPVGPASPPAAGIDLDVDYDAEIRPHLGRCIVRKYLAQMQHIAPRMGSRNHMITGRRITATSSSV